MKRDYKENPQRVLSLKARMRKFIDVINEAKIFNEKIPYMVVHQGENYYNSKLELNLTFKENINWICNAENSEKKNEQFIKYILDKLNNIPNIVVNETSNKVFLELLDKTNENYYKSYMVAYVFEIFSQSYDKNENDLNKCNLIIRIYNRGIPLFEIYSI